MKNRQNNKNCGRIPNEKIITLTKHKPTESYAANSAYTGGQRIVFKADLVRGLNRDGSDPSPGKMHQAGANAGRYLSGLGLLFNLRADFFP